MPDAPRPDSSLRKVAEAASPTDARVEFRKVMGLFTTGVCVISVPAGEHGVTAMTVNSLVSVSLDPMLLCWSLQNDASQFDIYMNAPAFAVSILSQSQAELALRYAARGDALLRPEDFTQSDSGLPVIADALSCIECTRWADMVAGDHTMIFGEVAGMTRNKGPGDACAPLGFFNGKFCSIETTWTS